MNSLTVSYSNVISGHKKDDFELKLKVVFFMINNNFSKNKRTRAADSWSGLAVI